MSPATLLTNAPSSMTTRPSEAAPRIREWREPVPHRAVMWVLGIVSRWLMLRGWFRVRALRIPAADRGRLVHAVNPRTAAFIGPNHPEFGSDWIVDKELSTLVAPWMASWADRGIVRSAPKFWGMNHLIANDGGEAALDYSVQVALRGDGVLLHPEGSVRWTNDFVHPLFPGIARMALSAAGRTDAPVFIVPVVWKYHFTRDVSRSVRREIRYIERALSLPTCDDADVARCFATLQENILRSRMERFGFTPSDPAADFFTRQDGFRRQLILDLTGRHVVEQADDTDKLIARVARAVREKREARLGDDKALRRDLEMAEEAKRLGEFPRAIYGSARLTQEQVSESLKRIRDRLVRRGWRNTIAIMLPRPLGPRVVHVGVPEPIRVDGSLGEEELLRLTRTRMQASLDEINGRVASLVTYANLLA